MEDTGDLLQNLVALREQAELAELSERLRIVSHFADSKTTLFDVWNSKLNHFFVLAENKADALSIIQWHGHVINPKLARIRVANKRNETPEMQKFFSAAARAAAKRAQGIVINQNGFAVMKHGGQIYMPLSVVAD